MMIEEFNTHYTASDNWALGANPTDIAMFIAGANPVLVHRVYVAGSQAGSAVAIFSASRRPLDNTGGARIEVPSAYHGEKNVALAKLYKYTAAPTSIGSPSEPRFRNTPFTFTAGQPSGVLIDWTYDEPHEHFFIKLQPGERLGIAVQNIGNSATAYLSIRFSEPN